MSGLDARLAARSAVALYLTGAVPLAVAAGLGHTSSPASAAGLAGAAALLAATLVALGFVQAPSLAVVFAAELSGLGLVAGVVAISGQTGSDYAPFFLFPLVHTAVFQPRWRVMAAWLVGVGAFLAPLGYDSDIAGEFPWIAAVTLVGGLLIAGIIHMAVDRLRRERGSLAHREAEALQMAEVDDLTGVGNHRRFRRALASECARSRRHRQPFSLIVLDLDGFKAINDELGHQAGDEALRRVADALSTQLRTEDVLCRQGGDEFAVIAVGAGGSEGDELAARLAAAVSVADQPDVRLSASCGRATYGVDGATPDDLLSRADRTLREAKGHAPAPAPAAPRHDPRRRVTTLAALSRALALARDEAGVVEVAVVHVADAVRARRVEVWRRRRPGAPPVLVASGHTARGRRAREADRHPDGEAPDPADLDEVLRRNRVLAPDSAGSGQLLVPISHAGQATGVLLVVCEHGAPGPEARRLALAMATQVGRALAAVEALSATGLAAARRAVPPAAREAAPERVAELAVQMGRRLGMSESDLGMLARAAELHDVGLIGVPAGLLLRPSRLSQDEARILHEHPLIAERLVRPMVRNRATARVVRHAYERYDGAGYPDGLAGDRIPLGSRVLHAAIAFEAMVSPRPYRAPLSVEQAREEARRVAGSQLDPQVVEALQEVLDQAPPEWAPAAV